MATWAIYVRKSRYTKQGESIENQIQFCKNYSKLKGVNVDFIVYEDEGFSGGNIDRPGFKQMMKDAEAKKFEVVSCYKLDRISRSLSDFSSIIEQFAKLDIQFLSVTEQFDTTTPIGRAMLSIIAVFAQLERETIAERVTDNMLELAKLGRWLGGQTPLGFNSTPVESYDSNMKLRRMCTLTEVPEELKIVKIIYSKYLELQSLSQVNKYLLSNNIKTKKGADWNKKQVQQVLVNPVYVMADESILEYLASLGMSVAGIPNGQNGILTYNKKEGRKKQKNIAEWIAAVAKHKGVVSASDWLKVQHTLNTNKEKAPRIGRSHNALLTGALRCAKCGSSMRVAYGRLDAQTGEKTFYYTCTMKNYSGGTRCDNKNVKGIEIENQVIGKLQNLFVYKDKYIKDLLDYKKNFVNFDLGTKIDETNKNIAEYETIKKRLIKNLSYIDTDNPSVIKDISSEINEYNARIDKLRSELKNLSFKNQRYEFEKDNINYIINSLESFSLFFNNCHFLEKKSFIQAVINKVTWNGDNGTVEVDLFGIPKKK
jgi:site-specific DNA recombinase